MTTRTAHPSPAATKPAAPVAPRSAGVVWLQSFRHHLRLMRTSSIAWIAALTGVSAGVVATFDDRYSTEEELAALAEMEGIPAFEALVGRYVEPATVEGLALSRWGMFGILVAVWGMLAAVRLLRGEEEAGHVEPLRAGLLTARGHVSSVLAALFAIYLVLAVAIGASHTALGMDGATSWALGGTVALLAASFAAAGTLASQLVASRRHALGIAGGFLGVLLGVRIVAASTATPDWVWWATPFGWTGFLHEIDEARVTVLAAFTVLVLVLTVAAVALARRDLHAGLVGGAERSVTRARPVRSQTALAVRLTAAPARTWALIIALVGLAFGLLARDFSEAARGMPTTVELANQLGWVAIDTPEGIVAFTGIFSALLLTVFAAGQAASIREEEATWRVEHLLVRPLGRARWLLSRTVVATAAVVLLALIAGLAAWLGTALIGTPLGFVDGVLAGVNLIPVALLFLGIGIGTAGVAPRLTSPVTYGVVVAAYLLDFVGGFLDLPDAVMDASPFRHLAAVPATGIAVGPALVMLMIGLAGVVVGLLAFRRRDLQEA